jgi:hypothetical protein
MKLPGSIRPDHRAFFEEYDDAPSPTGMLQTVNISVQHVVFPQLQSMTRFVEAFTTSVKELERVQGASLSYPITLWTLDFFALWTPKAYHEGIFRNVPFWDSLQQFYTSKCTPKQLFTLTALTNKSHLYLLPFLRDGKVPQAFLRRCHQWRPLYGFFPLFHYVLSKKSYTEFVRHVLPTISREEIEKGLGDMVEEVDALFENAPPLLYNLVVYRGLKHFDYGPKHGYQTWTDPAFVSTTLHPLHALRYKNPTGACCVQRLTIPTTCKVLLLQGLSNFENEWEILLPRNLKFRITGKKEIQVLTENEWSSPHPRRFQSVVIHEVRVYPVF